MSEIKDKRIDVGVYRSGKGREGLRTNMSYELALRIAVGDRDAIEMLTDAIARTVELTEEKGGIE